MLPTDLTTALARIAHTLWLRRMAGHGWKFGQAYNPEARTHDAMVPFDRLSEIDRRATERAVGDLDLEDVLAEAVEYERGPERPMQLDEMRAGLEVGWALDTIFDDPARAEADERGRIVSWEADGGELTRVLVRWMDGAVSQHCPADKELRRIGW